MAFKQLGVPQNLIGRHIVSDNMNNRESDAFDVNLSTQGFSLHDIKVIKAILEGENSYNQEDIICICEYNLNLLRKLGWLRRVRKAANSSDLHIEWGNC